MPFESNPPPDAMPDLDLDVENLPLTQVPDQDSTEKEGADHERSDDE